MEKTVYPIKEFFSKGGHLASPWDNLSIREKAEMMKVAVRNGITNLSDIKQKYNEFAGGGRKKSKANSLKQNFLTSLDQSLREDGTFNTPQYRRFFTDLARQESGYYPTITNSIGAKGYFQLMPGNRSASWSNPTQQFHETYKLVKSNIDYFNKKLTKKDWDRARELGIDLYGLLGGAHLGGVGGVVRALRGKGNAKDMNGSSVLGYMRQFSQSGKPTTYTQVPQAPQVSQGVPPISEPIQSMPEDTVDFIPWNPQAFFGVNNNTPIIIQQETPVVEERMPTPEEIERQERQQGLANFQTIMGMLNSTSDNTSATMTPFESTVSMLTQQSPIHYFSDGGSIHIKPENRGRFTALKERTGHSASWFKEHGTPAQKKMATFALNARHWKHDLGGNLYEFGGDGDNENIIPWKALDNIDYKAIPDTTFTKDKTGTGSIEYFNSLYPEGITYPNGYHREHPLPGKDVILYNPNDNDRQDIRLDALHIMPKDATYDVLNTLYREAAKDGDVAYNAKRRYEEDLNKYGKENIDSYTQYFNNEADGLLRNMLIEGTPEYIESKRYYPNKGELREWNRHLLPYIDNIQKYLETGERPTNILPEVTVYGKRRKKRALGGNLFEDGGNTKAGIPVVYPEQGHIYEYLNDHPNESVVLDEQTVVGHAPNASQRLAKYLQEAPARDIDKVMAGYLAAGIAPVAIQAAAPGVLAASDAIGGSAAGQAASKVLTSPYVSKGIEAAFAGHGLNHAINEGIDGYGDAAMTALELTPLGGLAKPVFKEAATTVESYRYPFGKPQVPEGYSNLKPQVKSYSNSSTEVPFFTWGNDNRFMVSPIEESYKDLYNQLSAAKKYKESSEYADLVRKAGQEAKSLGIGDFPEDLFTAPNGKSLKVIFESRPKRKLGEYIPEDNAIRLDMPQSEDMEVPYHEGLHWQRVGNPDNIGPKFNKWWEARKSSQPDAIQQKLFEDFRNSEEYDRYIKRRNADKYLEHKVNNALYPFADTYLRAKGELQAHGLEAGRAIGLKPFSPYPGMRTALNAVDRARSYNPYLNDVKSGGEENVKNFWDILTGQYAPSLISLGLVGTGYGLTNK